MKTRVANTFVRCLLFFAITGCASKSIQKDFTFNDQSNEGLVVFSVSHDLAAGRGIRTIFYLNGGVDGKEGKMVFSLNEPLPNISGASDFEDSYGQLIVLALPAGKHEVSSWRIANKTNGFPRILPRQDPVPLKFEVVAGQAKYLGNLHANVNTASRLGITIALGGYPEVRAMQDRDIALFVERYPHLKGRIVPDLLKLGPWTTALQNRGDAEVQPAAKLN